MSQEYRYILRIMGTDVQGTLKTSYAVAQVKGVSMSLSNAILKKAGVNPDLRVGFLTESDISKIEDVIKDPAKYSLPTWLFNRRKDSETGKDMHLLSADLVLRTKMDIDEAKEHQVLAWIPSCLQPESSWATYKNHWKSRQSFRSQKEDSAAEAWWSTSR